MGAAFYTLGFMFKFKVPEKPDFSQNPPLTFAAFIKYVWQKNPLLWFGFFLQDIIHVVRYPIAFILTGQIIDILNQSAPVAGIPEAVIHRIYWIGGILFLGEMMHVWTAQILVHWKPALRKSIRSDFLRHTLQHSHAYFQDNFAGAIARKVSEVAESTLRLHDIIRFQLLFSIINITINLIYMFSVDWRFGLALSAFLASISIPLLLRVRTINRRSMAIADVRAKVAGTIVDIFTNASAVKSFANASFEEKTHANAAREEAYRASKVIRSMVGIDNMRRMSLVLIAVGMASLASFAWSIGMMTVGEVSAVMSLTMMLTSACWMLGAGMIQFVDESGYIGDSLKITALPHGIKDQPNSPSIDVSKGYITYDAVQFAFGNNPMFDALSVQIKSGEKIALVGHSGAGKSTFVTLLLRLFDIQGGRISIDGQDIAGVTQDSLRSAIAVIPQDTILFHRSLRENIRYGRIDATDAEVEAAARRAHAHEFIQSLDLGYDTLVGERGIRLSGGQRQRIAIARAILKNAPILILDEATSALDSESEQLIQTALFELMRDKTVIAIAHRLSTIAAMDRILVFEKGKIKEEGSHADLIARPTGLYAHLWAMQSGGFLPDSAKPLVDIGGQHEIDNTISESEHLEVLNTD